MGKPAITFFRAAMDDLGIAPEQAVLIGDGLADDTGGAQAAGIPGILVRTEKYRRKDEEHALIHPALILDDYRP